MAKRYVLCGIVGTGSREDPYRAIVQGFPGINATFVIRSGSDGRPNPNVAFARVGGKNLAPILSMSDVEILPDFPLDAKLNAMHTATRHRMKQQIVARGFDPSVVDDADGFRDVIRGVGLFLQPGFNEDTFDVSEEPAV